MSRVGAHPAGGHAVADAHGMCPAFAGSPLPPAQLCRWDTQPWAGAALPKSAVAWGFCPRGSACPGPVRASDVISVERSRPGKAAARTVMKVLSVICLGTTGTCRTLPPALLGAGC